MQVGTCAPLEPIASCGAQALNQKNNDALFQYHRLKQVVLFLKFSSIEQYVQFSAEHADPLEKSFCRDLTPKIKSRGRQFMSESVLFPFSEGLGLPIFFLN